MCSAHRGNQRLAYWAIAALLVDPTLAQAADCHIWPAWIRFQKETVQADGRVVDSGTPPHYSTSEGQAYTLFFALVANDRATFDKVLTWTQNNLAGGDLGKRLPAWQWGRHDNGNWGVLDDNPASDADLWLSYTLAEASRLWHQPYYDMLSRELEERIRQEEVAELPGLGPALLPGPHGFHPSDDRWRLNPGYLTLQLMARLRSYSPEWQYIADTSFTILMESAPKGYVPDWVSYQASKGLQPDAESQARGSYGAIRVYLWAGMLAPATPGAAALQRQLLPMTRWLHQQGSLPETVGSLDGVGKGTGPAGFTAAMLPLLEATHQDDLWHQQFDTLTKTRSEGYYNQVLSLFGLGWANGCFRFAPDGTLTPYWRLPCTASACSPS